MNIECRWQSAGDEWHTGTLLAFVPVPGRMAGSAAIIAMVALRSGRIVEMDYTRLRIGKEIQR